MTFEQYYTQLGYKRGQEIPETEYNQLRTSWLKLSEKKMESQFVSPQEDPAEVKRLKMLSVVLTRR